MIKIIEKNDPNYVGIKNFYIEKKDGTKIEIKSLTEDEILELIFLDLKDYYNTENSSYSYDKNDLIETVDYNLNKVFENPYPGDRKRALDSISFGATLYSIGHPCRKSKYFLFKLGQLRKLYPEKIIYLCRKMNVESYYDEAVSIARFQKDCAEDFSEVSWDDLLGILEQLVINEKNRKNSKNKKQM